MIIKDKNICNGKPVIKGKRIGPKDLIMALNDIMIYNEGKKIGEMIRKYYFDLTDEEIKECLKYYLD